MISAYGHGRHAAQYGKHIQACPFDTGTPEWREWRKGYCDELVTSSQAQFKQDFSAGDRFHSEKFGGHAILLENYFYLNVNSAAA
jgi:hypothetical protein